MIQEKKTDPGRLLEEIVVFTLAGSKRSTSPAPFTLSNVTMVQINSTVFGNTEKKPEILISSENQMKKKINLPIVTSRQTR